MKKTCAECGFTLFDGDESVLTEFGWAHPTCVMDGSDWKPKSWL
jgi:hypothetical protein